MSEFAMSEFALPRRMMVDCQLRTYDITDSRVLDVMGELPRERFVSPSDQVLAYTDQSPAASDGRDSPQARRMLIPMVLARLIQSAEVHPGCRALDVATGLGYGAAVMARLGAAVTALESDADLAAGARAVLADVAPGVTVVEGPLAAGHAAGGPFDVILVEGSFEVEPRGLFEQLADDGRLVAVKGVGRSGRAMVYRKSGGVVSGRPVFDAAAPLLAEFKAEPVFAF